MTTFDDDIDAWLAGELGGERATAFARRLREDPGAARHLLRAARFEEDLAREIHARAERRRLGFASTRLRLQRRTQRLSVPTRSHLALAIAALLLLGVGLVIARHQLAPAEPAAVATLENIDGAVELRRGTQLLVHADAIALRADDRVVVPSSASATLRFADGTSFALRSGTTATVLAEAPGKRLYISAGTLDADVRKQANEASLQIATPHGRVTVLGTRFTLSVSHDRTTLAVSEGRVALDDVRSNERMIVAAGHAQAVGPAVRPAPRVVRARDADPRIGIELPGVGETSVELPFVDVFRCAGPWRPGGAGDALTLDADGWVARLEPGQTAETAMCRDLRGRYPKGRYICRYDGTGSIGFGGDATVISSAPGRIEVAVDPGNAGIVLTLHETSVADPVRNIQVLMPGTEAKAPSAPFHQAYLDRWRGAAVIHAGAWCERRSGDTLYRATDRLRPGHGPLGRGRGRPIEDSIDLARALGADVWLRLPHQASDDYVDAIARVVHERLAPGQRVYLELGRDCWDGAWEAGIYARAQGEALGLGGRAGIRWYSQRSLAVFQRWQAIAGDDPRIVRVLSLIDNPYIVNEALAWHDARSHVDAIAILSGLGGVVSYTDSPDEVFALDAAGACDRLRASLHGVADRLTRVRELCGDLRIIGVRCGPQLSVNPKSTPPPNWRHFVHVAQFLNEPDIRTILAEYLTLWQRANPDLILVSLPMDPLRTLAGTEGQVMDAMGLSTYQAIEPALRRQAK